jgi:hypothetical protein
MLVLIVGVVVAVVACLHHEYRTNKLALQKPIVLEPMEVPKVNPAVYVNADFKVREAAKSRQCSLDSSVRAVRKKRETKERKKQMLDSVRYDRQNCTEFAFVCEVSSTSESYHYISSHTQLFF